MCNSFKNRVNEAANCNASTTFLVFTIFVTAQFRNLKHHYNQLEWFGAVVVILLLIGWLLNKRHPKWR